MKKYQLTLLMLYTMSVTTASDSDSGSCISVDLERTKKKPQEPVTPTQIVTSVQKVPMNMQTLGAQLPAVQVTIATPPPKKEETTPPAQVVLEPQSPTFQTGITLPQPVSITSGATRNTNRAQSVPAPRSVLPVVQVQTKDDAQVSYLVLSGAVLNQAVLVGSAPGLAEGADLSTASVSPDGASSVSLGSTRQDKLEDSGTPTFPIGTPEPSSNGEEITTNASDTPTRCLRCTKKEASPPKA